MNSQAGHYEASPDLSCPLTFLLLEWIIIPYSPTLERVIYSASGAFKGTSYNSRYPQHKNASVVSDRGCADVIHYSV